MYLLSLVIIIILTLLTHTTHTYRRRRNPPPPPPLICNGSPEWCRLRFDQFTFLGTHNSQAYNLKLECLDKPDPLYLLTCNALKSIPSINDCFYNNQWKHPLTKQLEDGVRALDIDLGLWGDELRASHGFGDYVAYGDSLKSMLSVIKGFLTRNTREVLTLEFGDFNSDAGVLIPRIISLVEQELGGYLLSNPPSPPLYPGAPWPTLGEMIWRGQRVVVFISSLAFDAVEGALPSWALNREAYFNGAWTFTHRQKQPGRIGTTIKEYCDESLDERWLGCDFEYSLEVDLARKTLLSQPNLCIADASAIINPSIPDTVNYCHGKKVLHRIRTDNYERGVELRKLVNLINKKNAQRYLYSGGGGGCYC